STQLADDRRARREWRNENLELRGGCDRARRATRRERHDLQEGREDSRRDAPDARRSQRRRAVLRDQGRRHVHAAERRHLRLRGDAYALGGERLAVEGREEPDCASRQRLTPRQAGSGCGARDGAPLSTFGASNLPNKTANTTSATAPPSTIAACIAQKLKPLIVSIRPATLP